METFLRFLYEFLGQFFKGFILVFNAIIEGVKSLFDFSSYLEILNFYKKDFSGPEWLFVTLVIIILVLIVAGIFLLIFFFVRKYIRFRKTLVEQEDLLEEVAKLNDEVSSLVKEKEDILAMKVSHLGLRPDEVDEEEISKVEEEIDTMDTRFPKLTNIDINYSNYQIKNYNNTFTLEELVELFRNFAASKLRLYYKTEMIRLFISALGVILVFFNNSVKTSILATLFLNFS